MKNTLFFAGALALAGCSSSQVKNPQLAHDAKSEPQQMQQQKAKQPKSTVVYMSKSVNPPLTKQEIKKAKGGLVWRKVPYAELSEAEKKDPKFWIGIDSNTGQVTSMMNP